jgi:hypothetical protein
MRLPGGTVNSLDFDLFPLRFCSLGAWGYSPAHDTNSLSKLSRSGRFESPFTAGASSTHWRRLRTQ